MRNSQLSQKEVIKEKILSNLKDEELQIISLTDNQQKIYWEEEGKEFSFNGKMYDVVKSKTIKGKVVLYCIDDKKEKQLIENYNSITKQNSSTDKKGKNNIDNSTTLFVYTDEITNSQSFSLSSKPASYLVSYLPQNISNKISPPPKA